MTYFGRNTEQLRRVDSLCQMRIMRKSPQEVQCCKLDFPFWKWCNHSSFAVGGQRVQWLSHHKPRNQRVVFLWPSCFLSNAYSHVGCRPPKATLLYVSCEEKLEKRKEKMEKRKRKCPNRKYDTVSLFVYFEWCFSNLLFLDISLLYMCI